jgi:hypothetical protein
MADLDEIVQKILLDGDAEVLSKFGEIASEGSKTFQELAEAAEKGASKMEIFGVAVAGLAAAFVGAAGAVLAYVEANDEAIQKTALLGEAFGATAAQISAMEAGFASLGVGVKTFESFATRLSVTIARDWPEIATNIRTAATEAVASQDAIAAASLRVQDAQRNLSFEAEQSASKMASANLHVEQTYNALQDGANRALATIRNDILALESANLGLEAAEQRLATLQGRPVSESDKKALELKEAQLAVDKAREAQTAAIQKQEQDRREAAEKAAQLEQAHADALLKRNILLEEQASVRAKAELQLREAVVAREAAEEKAAQQNLKSIPAIADAINSITKGGKEAASALDLSQVSVKNLIDGLIAAAAAGGKFPPDGMKVMAELTKVLAADTGHLINQQQRLAVVQQLSSRGFGSINIAASELLKALEKGPEVYGAFEEAAKKATFTQPKAIEDVGKFRDEMERLGFAIDIVNRNFAAAASPAFTKFLEDIRESLTSATGTLNLFVEGIKAIGGAIGFLIGQVVTFGETLDHAFNLEKGRSLQVIIAAIAAAVAIFATAWVGIPVLIALVVTALGYVSQNLEAIGKFYEEHKVAIIAIGTAVAALVIIFGSVPIIIAAISAAVAVIALNWDKVKAAAKSAIDGLVNSSFVKWLDSVWEKAKAIGAAISGWFKAAPDPTATQTASNGGAKVEGSEGGVAAATGGYITGPGSGTSDSIPARLSNGEFVVRSAAVSRFGTDFLHAINSMSLPVFASGGLVGAPARLAGGGAGPGPQSSLNLSIDGQTFRGLRGPSNVVSDLADFAVSRQASSAGRKPSWVK